MNQAYPSIFNDVIGPVMRGPSSSHCAAAVRIGRLARDLMGGKITDIRLEFHPQGSLATTHETQGSDMGLFAGLLGWQPTDERVVSSPIAIREAGINVRIDITDYPATHPNTYKMSLRNTAEAHEMTAISTGGGMIEVIQIDGLDLSIAGDYYETLVFCKSDGDEILNFLTDHFKADHIHLHQNASVRLIQIKAQTFLDDPLKSELKTRFEIQKIRTLSPVLPVLSRKDISVPFITCDELMKYNQSQKLDLWELAIHYESARGGISPEEVLQKMEEIIAIIQNSIEFGLAGTDYEDRILGYQSGNFQEAIQNQRLLDGGMLNRMILYTTALMETKSALGVIVAAPTAGACGGLPGAVVGAATELGLATAEMAKSMLAAGLIGVFIAAHSTFAAEVCGCQAECGSGSGMAAAALVTLGGGTAQQAIHAASLALQNILGMICDPVANRVEVPCLGKNVLAASNALACANMSLAGFDPVIPLDEVITAMDAVGKSLPVELRCTALGGLSITPTSKAIEKRQYA